MVVKGMAGARKYCQQNKLKLTKPREEVLGVLLKSKKPMGAYDILGALETKGKRPHPPTVYRAIDFWIKHGYIHKIYSLNAYGACSHPHEKPYVSYLICDECHQAQEIYLNNQQSTFSQITDFQVSSVATEIHGKCSRC